jgi:hypothetical protein
MLSLFNGSSHMQLLLPMVITENEKPGLTKRLVVTKYLTISELTIDFQYARKTTNIKMNLSIRPLLKKAFGECASRNTRRELSSRDSNLDGGIC